MRPTDRLAAAPDRDKRDIVLVRGAFGDGSHWRHIIPGLHRAGHRVVAAQNPLTSPADDVANTRKLAEWMGGPTLLVGHSYGGAVITGAGHAPNVAGLVPGLDTGPHAPAGEPALDG